MSKAIGRPSKFTQAIADTICERLAAGESLRAICRDEDMPTDRSVYRWLDDDDGFCQQYAQAREVGLDLMADEIIAIADSDPGITDAGATDTGAVADKRLRFDARRWYLSKLAPKKYGDKLDIDLKAQVAIGEMSEDEIKAELAALVATGLGHAPGDGSDLV
jgi:hypothetical protein